MTLPNISVTMRSTAWARSLPLYGVALLGMIQIWVYWHFFFQAYPLIPYYNIPLMDGGKISGWKDGAAIAQGIGYLLLFICYYGAYLLCLRSYQTEQPEAHRLVNIPTIIAAVAVLANMLLIFTYPFTAADIFENIVYARTLAVFHLNPMVVAPNQVPDQFLPFLAWPDLPTTYGPIWVLSSAFTALLGGDHLLLLVIIFKLWAVLWYVIGAFAVAGIMQQVRPALTWASVLLFAWNPLVLFEAAGNAHNDIMMTGLMLLAIFFLVRNHPVAAIVLLTASMLVKYLTVALLPFFALYILTSARFGTLTQRLTKLVRGMILSGLLVIVCYLPFVMSSGSATIFAGLSTQSSLATTSLARVIRIWLGVQPQDPTGDTIRTFLIAGFALLYLPQLWRATRGFTHFIGACYATFWLYMILIAFWFQPWYLIWLVGLAAIWPGVSRSKQTPQQEDQMLAARTTLYCLSAMLTYVIFYLAGLYGSRFGEWNLQSWAFLVAHGPVIVLALLQTPRLWQAALQNKIKLP